ncbi:UDP-galactose transporter [Pluteus cervinus]|uniref:UDP-galactose transporter n=1 Tax=Pluteus cervinus TaxID=181527 RepID=A0ACD3BAZ7_9AGAR|nr:UDP-galactose transporter [Pluteus cervinus]
MSFARLALCIVGVYSMFLLWAIAQERLSVPFKHIDGQSSEKFKSPLVMGMCQSILSSLSAFLYIQLRRKPGDSFMRSLGLEPPTEGPPTSNGNGVIKSNGSTNPKSKSNGSTKTNGHTHPSKPSTRYSTSSLLLHYLQCSLFITSAAPFGFSALSYISYPAMVLGKSCKLVPVMIMNVLLYRRKFAAHKYLVVAMVTTGITVFMFFGNEGSSKKKSHSSTTGNGTPATPYATLIGTFYLLLNLLLDGATNSTQDEIFTRHRQVTGQQMMFFINVFCTLISLTLSVLPLPYIPVIHPSLPSPNGTWTSEMDVTLGFIRTHPDVVKPLVGFAMTGALGQLFIFETLQHFGSLTLVTITLTRKLFTMLLSVVVYNHTLTLGQWFGAAVVFAGISVEAFVKRKDVHAKRVIQEKEKAKLKSL